MDYIVLNFQPFTLFQEIIVYKNGESIFYKENNIDNITNLINKLRKEYNINKVTLCGNKFYLSKFQKEMMTKFEDNNCEITIVER